MTARLICLLAATVLIGSPTLRAQDGPPRDNPYDVIGRMLAPFMPVLLSGGKGTNNACVMTLTMTEVTGHLPKQMEGSVLRAAVEFPDKVRLQAPVLGEEITVCRNGNDVWAVPGAKVEYLLKQFKVKPGKTVKKGTPIFLPLTAQQAAFIPALFTIYNADTAEISNLDGVDCRLITAGLMPDLARAAKAEGFRAQLWIAPGYLPRRITIKQPDLSATVTITDLKFGPALQAAMWQPPAGVTDIYHTDADHLDGVLYVIMNSLKTKDIAPAAAPSDTPAAQ